MENLKTKLDAIVRFHQLLEQENTGNANKLSKKLGISRSKLFGLKEDFESFGAVIKYDFMRETYYYESAFEVLISFMLGPSISSNTSSLVHNNVGLSNFQAVLTKS